MAQTIRIGTFNVENLFSRPKVFNFADHSDGDKQLKEIAKLQGLLNKTVYDKTAIFNQYKKLKDYITVREDRGKLFKYSGFAKKGIKANGKNDWDGALELKRSKFSATSRGNTGKVIRGLKADIVCLVEVEDRPTLKFFNTDRLSSRFPYQILFDGNDNRGIDVALLSRFPTAGIWTHIFDKKNGKQVFSRDCLEVQVDVPQGPTIYVLCNHFKSRGYGNSATSDEKRKLQSKTVAKILDDYYDLETDYVVVAGDLNDSPDRKPEILKSLLKKKHLHDVLELQFPGDTASRWTYYYRKREQIDYILVSKPLADAFKSAKVERRGIYDLKTITNGAEKSYSKVTHWTNAASDHAAIVAEFEV